MSTLINLGGLKKAAPKKAQAEKPTLPDPFGEFAQEVTLAIQSKAAVDAHTLQLDQCKTKFSHAVVSHLFRTAHGQSQPEDTFQILCPSGKALVSVKNAYKMPEDLAQVRVLLGDHADVYLGTATTITIDASAIPERVLQFVVDEIVKLARSTDEIMLGVEGDGPVFNAISVKQVTVLDKAFHADRHRLFTPEQNVAIQHAMPAIVSTKLDYQP